MATEALLPNQNIEVVRQLEEDPSALPPIDGYWWIGDSTIRMIKQKYPWANVDNASFLNAGDPSIIEHIKRLGIERLFMTSYWGFRDESDQDDFMAGVLPEIHSSGLETYGYVQGPNLVCKDFEDTDWWVLSAKGGRAPYFTGRHLVCPNNPGYMAHFRDKVGHAVEQGFHGVYIDNVVAGPITPVLTTDLNEFHNLNCYCDYCREGFRAEYGISLPEKIWKASPEQKFMMLRFRQDTIHKYMAGAREEIDLRGNGRKVNLSYNGLDPYYDLERWVGVDRRRLFSDGIVDEVVFEHHSFPFNGSRNPEYIEQIALHEPNARIVSLPYHAQIGFAPHFSQQELNMLAASARQLYLNSGARTCMKLTEFTNEDGVWSNFNFQDLARPDPRGFGDYREATSYIGRNHAERWSRNPAGRAFLRHTYLGLIRMYFDGELFPQSFKEWLYKTYAK